MQNIYYVQNGEKSRKPLLLAYKYIRTKLKRSHSNRNLMKMPKEHEFQNYSHNFLKQFLSFLVHLMKKNSK